MTAKVITTMPELVAALRSRRDELNISHELLDDIAGLQSGYTSKLLAPVPGKNLGYMSLGAIMGALGVSLVLVEDSARRALVESRWRQRKRPPNIPTTSGALNNDASGPMLLSTSGDTDVQATFEFPTEA